MTLPLSGGAESWRLELPPVHPSAQNLRPGPHLGTPGHLLSRTTSGVKHFHVQANTATLILVHTYSLSCTYALVCTHKGHTRTLSPLTHKHSLKQRKPGEGHSTDSFYALHSFLVKLQQQSLNSIHHALLVNDLQFESQFPLPVPGEPEPLGGPHPLELNSEGGGEVQAPTCPLRVQPAGARTGRILRGSAL